MRNLVLTLALLCIALNASILAQSNCNTQVTINPTFTSMQSPLAGPYQPGERVTFCLNIDGFNQTDCNWLHGVVPEFGEGWDPISFLGSGQPKNIITPLVPHTNGFWDWFPENWIRYKTNSVPKNLGPGDGVGAGWFFKNFAQPSINPFDPNFTRGDGTDCSAGGNTWQVCFSLITKDLQDCPDIVDCSVAFTTFGDGETGSYGTPACVDDGKIVFNATLDCCDAAVLNPIADLFICNNDEINIPLSSDNPDATYAWTVQSFNISGATAGTGNVIQNELSLIQEGFQTFAIYSVVATIDGCEGPVETFQVNISNLIVDLGDDQYICPGQTVRVGEFPEGGATPYTYEWEHGPTNYRPLVSPDATTTYYITVTDAHGCSTTNDITVWVGQAGPIDGPTALCGLNTATYTIPSFPGATAYTWTTPANAPIISGQGTTSIRVDWSNAIGGEVCVKPNNGCVSGITQNCIDVSRFGAFGLNNIEGNEDPCPGSLETYSIFTTEPNVTFDWSVDGGEIISGQGSSEIIVDWNGTTNTSPQAIVSVEASTVCAADMRTLDVRVDWGALFTLSGIYTICPGEVATYNATIWNGSVNQMEWTVSPGATILSGQGTTNIVVDWGAAIDPFFNFTVFGDCVTSSDGAAITIFDPSNLGIDGPSTVCAGETVNYTPSIGVPSGVDYQWSFPSNFQPLSNPNGYNLSGQWTNDSDGEISVTIEACNNAPYTESLLVTASSGMVTDTVVTLCPGLCFTIAGETYCDPGNYTINNPNGGSCGDVINIYFFHLDQSDVITDAGDDTNVGCTVTTVLTGAASSYPGGSSFTWQDPFGNIIGNDLTQEVSEAGIYSLTIYNSLTQCQDTDDVEVFPSAPPTADAGPDRWVNCFNNFQTQLMALENSNWTYSWTGPNGFTSNEARPIVTAPGDYLLDVTDLSTGCGSANDMVTVIDGYVLDIEFTQSICNNLDGTATVSSEGIDSPTYLWSTGGTTATITDLAPGIYTVAIGSTIGTCSTFLDVEVTADLSCKVVIAGNVFDDGANGDCDPVDPDLLLAADIPVTIMPLGQTVFTDQNGYYEFIVDTGDYSLTVEVPEPYFVLCPGFQVLDIYLNDTSAVSTDNHFFLDYLTNFDLTINAYSNSPTAGEDQRIQVQYCNYFFQTINGRIELIHDSRVTFDPIAQGADFYDPDTYTASWLFAGLSWFNCEWLNFEVQIPGDIPSGTVLEHTIIGRPLLGDLQPSNNYAVISRAVTESSSNPNPQENIIPTQTQFVQQDITVFPNPTRNNFVVKSGENGNNMLSVKMLDIMGRAILQANNEEGSNKINVNIPQGTAPGIYLLQIEMEQGMRSRKLIIEPS